MLDIFSFFVYTVRVMKNLKLFLSGCDEEVLKNRFLNRVGHQLNTVYKIDHVGKNLFLETKVDDDFRKLKTLATVVAQILGYCNRVYFSKKKYETCELKKTLVVLSNNSGAIFNTKDFEKYYSDCSGKYDWDIAASKSDKKLISDLCDEHLLINARVFDLGNDVESEIFENAYKAIENDEAVFLKKPILISMIDSLYLEWRKKTTFITNKKSNATKLRDLFYADICNDTSRYDADAKKLTLIVNGEEIVFTRVYPQNYSFWQNYDKIEGMNKTNFRAKADRLLDMADRRWKGDFYTPNAVAKLAWDYIWKNVPYEDLLNGKVVINENCAGSGNLIFPLNEEAHKHCVISTYRKDDAEYCSETFADAIVFQCDYLNDFVEEGYFNSPAITDKIRARLNDPNTTLIFNINPPYSNASNKKQCTKSAAKINDGDVTKDGISDTLIKNMMEEVGQEGAASQLYVQFIYRILEEVSKYKCKVILGIFCPVTFFSNSSMIDFREKFFNKKFLGGFMFSNICFHGTSSTTEWGVGYTLWDLRSDISLESQELKVDIINYDFDKIGTRSLDLITTKNKNNLLKSKFVKVITTRGKNKMMLPTQKGVYNFTNTLRSVHPDHICAMSLETKPDGEISTYVVPSIHNGHVGFSVVPENFENSFVSFGARKSYNTEWYYVGANYKSPDKDIPTDVRNDLIIYGVFCENTKSASYDEIEVVDKNGEVTNTFKIKNGLMPFTRDDLRSNFFIADENIIESLNEDTADRFFATWLQGKTFTTEAQSVLNIVKKIYKHFYSMEISCDDFYISSWDVGFHQIVRFFRDSGDSVCKKLLGELNDAMDILRKKNSSAIWDYGFLEKADLF